MPYLSLVFLILSDMVFINFFISWKKRMTQNQKAIYEHSFDWDDCLFVWYAICFIVMQKLDTAVNLLEMNWTDYKTSLKNLSNEDSIQIFEAV